MTCPPVIENMQRHSIEDYNHGFGFPDGEKVSRFEFTFLTPCTSSQEGANGCTQNTYLLSQDRSELTKCTSLKLGMVTKEKSFATGVAKIYKGFNMDSKTEQIGKTNKLCHRWSKEEVTARLVSKNCQAQVSRIGDATKRVRFKDSKELDLNVQARPYTLYTGNEAARNVILPSAKESPGGLDVIKTRVNHKVLSGQNEAAAEGVNGRVDDLLQDGEDSSQLTPNAFVADRRALTWRTVAAIGNIKSWEHETVADAKSSLESLACARKEDLVPPENENHQTAIKPNLSAAVSQIELEEIQAFDRKAELRLQSEYLRSMQAGAENLTIDEPYECVEVETANLVSGQNFGVDGKIGYFDPYDKSIGRVACSEYGTEQEAFSLHQEEILCEIETDSNKRNLSDFKRSCSIVDSVSLHQYGTDRPTDYGNAHLHHREDHPWCNRMNCKESNRREQIIARLTKSRTKLL